jgi:PAS domain S-box-containing protein
VEALASRSEALPRVLAAAAEELARAERIRGALYAITQTSSAAEDLPAFYAAIHRIVGTLMNAGNFFIALHDRPKGRITFPYFADEHDQSPGEIPFGRGLTTRVILSGEELHATEEDWERLEKQFGIVPVGTAPVDWLGVPLKTRGAAFGALVVQSYDPNRRFTPAEFELLTFVSRHVAVALERRRAEDALREIAEQYRLLFDKNPHPTWVTELGTGRFLAVNEAAVALYGWEKDELLGMVAGDLAAPGAPAHAEAASGEGTPARHRRKDGSLIDVELTSHPLVFEGHRAELVMAIDVTHRLSLEEQLRQSQKMDAVGKLAGGIAHDFNNVLTTVLGYTELLLSQLPPEAPAREALLEIRSAGERAAALTKRLLAFSRKQVLEPQTLDLNGVVSESGNLLRRLIGEDIELVIDAEPGVGTVRADPGQIEQVLMNLVLNARDAMPGGGRIVVETRAVDGSAPPEGRPALPAGRWVSLVVRDTGVGMDDDTRRQAFEPFFTTKPKGKGTGLGLAVVYGIARQAGGDVWAESVPGKGSAFHVLLPVAEGVREEPPAPAEAPSITGGRESILVVEDDEKIRGLMSSVLSSAGYRVHAAKDGEEALEFARRYPGRLHLVLTDVVMPRLNGRELVERLLPERPEVQVLYTSGYTDDALSARDIVDAGAELLRKPFTPTELLARVRLALGARRASRSR